MGVRAAMKDRFFRHLIVSLLLIPATPSTAQEDAGGLVAGERTMSELLAEAQRAFDARDYGKADMLFSEFSTSYRDEPQAVEFIARVKPLRALSKLRLKKFKAALPLVEEVSQQQGAFAGCEG